MFHRMILSVLVPGLSTSMCITARKGHHFLLHLFRPERGKRGIVRLAPRGHGR